MLFLWSRFFRHTYGVLQRSSPNALMPSPSDHDNLGAIGVCACLAIWRVAGVDLDVAVLASKHPRQNLLVQPTAWLGMRRGHTGGGCLTAIWFAIFMVPFFLNCELPNCGAAVADRARCRLDGPAAVAESPGASLSCIQRWLTAMRANALGKGLAGLHALNAGVGRDQFRDHRADRPR
jgi:hypothetical protein